MRIKLRTAPANVQTEWLIVYKHYDYYGEVLQNNKILELLSKELLDDKMYFIRDYGLQIAVDVDYTSSFFYIIAIEFTKLDAFQYKLTWN